VVLQRGTITKPETRFQSTGKTTLVRALAKKLDLDESALVMEVARGVMAIQGFTRNDVGSLAMQQAIVEAQLKEEERKGSSPILVCDRSAVDAIVYALVFSTTPEEADRRRDALLRTPGFDDALQRYRSSNFVLCGPVPEWLKDDGVRSLENQVECFNAFRSLLQDLDITFQVIGSDIKDLDQRVVAMKGLLRL
jgi:nicotinamide riboside kinase